MAESRNATPEMPQPQGISLDDKLVNRLALASSASD
jgi:hypothetical protein